jgi:signal transduction histidine kinase
VWNQHAENGSTVWHRTLKFRVEADKDAEPQRVLVIGGPGLQERRVPIPASDSTQVIRQTLRQGLLASGLLLALGLAAAALFAHRVAGPLRRLALGAEALGRGDLGTQVELRAHGELGELESAFNRMSARLAELEGERRAWLAREHLAELGDLARGLAHTLRNPLHTLGLALDELASSPNGRSEELAGTARSQIRRIDRWLRSFLSLGAGNAAAPQPIDLGDLAREVALEASQSGARLALEVPEDPVCACGVRPALAAAVSSLVINALEATAGVSAVELQVLREPDAAVLRVLDRGPGVPDEVRRRLFWPHVTTKSAGSGMGLFLAKQLVEAGHGGSLRLVDRPGGGSVAEVRLPPAEADV